MDNLYHNYTDVNCISRFTLGFNILTIKLKINNQIIYLLMSGKLSNLNV